MVEGLREYVLANYQTMTAAEMFEVAKKEFNAKRHDLNNILTKGNIKAVSVADRIKKYIQENQDETADDIADKFKRGVPVVCEYARELGIKLRRTSESEPNDWLSQADVKEAEDRLKELMQNPKIISFLKGNNFLIQL